MRSSPVVVTRVRHVFRIIHDHSRAKPCCTRPLRSKREEISERVPKTPVYKKMSGSKIRYDRRLLSSHRNLDSCCATLKESFPPIICGPEECAGPLLQCKWNL